MGITFEWQVGLLQSAALIRLIDDLGMCMCICMCVYAHVHVQA